jgi:GNAT superfamily N-acetyltransferase
MSGDGNPIAALTYRVEQLAVVSPELREAALFPLREFNRLANPTWYAARDLPENAPQPVNLFAFDAAGQVIAGLFAETQFHWLKTQILAVHPNQRRQGLGKRLMLEAETIALQRGCCNAYVDTMEYQAPAFYERLGYTLAGRFPDWDSHGHAKCFYIKQLVAPMR